MDVLVIDEDPLTRFGLGTLLAPVARVVHEADDPVAALECARTQRPDVVVLDLRLRHDLAGIGLCRRLKKLARAPRVMVYSAHNAPQDIVSALAAGADSYVDKTTSCAGVLDAVTRTGRGDRVWALDRAPAPVVPARSAAGHPGLTRREQEVLALVMRRHTNEEIAAELVLARQTVKNHVSSALHKLGVASRRELFAATARRGARRAVPAA